MVENSFNKVCSSANRLVTNSLIIDHHHYFIEESDRSPVVSRETSTRACS